MRTRLSALILVPLVLVVTGCAGSSPGDFRSPVQPSWTTQADLVGELVAHGDVVVSYYQSNDALRIGAWEGVHGEQLWSLVADVGSYTRGIVLQPSIVEAGDSGAVVYLAPGRTDWNEGWNRLRAVEVRTGRAIGFDIAGVGRNSEAPIRATSAPSRCEGTPSAACFFGTIGDSGASGPLRLDFDSATLSLDERSGAPTNARILGVGVYATDDRPPSGTERLGYSDGTVHWEVDYESVFGHGSSSDGGWSWARVEVDGEPVLIGSGGPGIDQATESRQRDLSAGRVVALDASTGEELWSIDRADPSCQAARITDALIDEVFPVCILKSATATFNETSELERFDVDLGIRGVDLRTGATVWERWLGTAASNYTTAGEDSTPVSDQAWRTVRDDLGWHALNALTGETAELDAESVVMCSRRDDSFVAVHEPGATVRDHGYNAGEVRYPCTLDLQPTAARVGSVGAIRQGAMEVEGGAYVLKGAEGLVGYRLD